MASRFVQYGGRPEMHDARVVALEHRGAHARVTLKSDEGHRFALEFSGVTAVEADRPLDLVLYALVEVAATAPARRFEFASAGDESDARLAIEAIAFTVVGDGMPPSPGV